MRSLGRTMWAGCLVLTLLPACRLGADSLSGVGAVFRVAEDAVDFGRLLEGDQAVQQVRVDSAGRADLSLGVSTTGPFAAKEELFVPAGGTVFLEVTFTAGNQSEAGELVLAGAGQTASVKLVGEGVRPPECHPRRECRRSRFNLEADVCVESVSPDGEACTPTGQCSIGGMCFQGECLGVGRPCDDKNVCTQDACSEELGCVFTPVACAPPTRPCRVATCDPAKGCLEVNADDGTPCGPVDCQLAHLCFAGACVTVNTPEGFVCAPATPCTGPGRCHNQVCEVPEPTELAFEFSAPLPGVPFRPVRTAPSLLANTQGLYFELCDGGCALHSYTANGFLRYQVPHAAGSRALLGASQTGVFLLGEGAVSFHAQANGEERWVLPFTQLPPPPVASGLTPRATFSAFAVGSQGNLHVAVDWAPDGGSPQAQTVARISSLGEVLSSGVVSGWGTQAVLALDEQDRLFETQGESRLLSFHEEDGGIGFRALGLWPAAPSLVAGRGRLLSGGQFLVDSQTGSLLAEVPLSSDGGFREEPVFETALLAGGRSFVFVKSCPPPGFAPCADEAKAIWVRALDADAGTFLWEAQVLPGLFPGFLEEAAVVSGGALLTVTQVSLDGGAQAHLQLFAAGERLLACPFPEGSVLGGAAFSGGTLYVLLERGGSWKLEAYRLLGIPLENTGWPFRWGLSGARRAVP